MPEDLQGLISVAADLTTIGVLVYWVKTLIDQRKEDREMFRDMMNKQDQMFAQLLDRLFKVAGLRVEVADIYEQQDR